MLLKGDEGGAKFGGVALRVTGTVPLPLGDPSTQRSMNRVVAQQGLKRQNFRVRGSGGDAVFRPAARWLLNRRDHLDRRHLAMPIVTISTALRATSEEKQGSHRKTLTILLAPRAEHADLNGAFSFNQFVLH